MNESQKLKHVVSIRNKIIQLIDSNQNIKRLLTYNTFEPLAEIVVNSNGLEVYQKDIQGSLINKNIFPMAFIDSLLTDSKSLVFCHLYSGDLKGEVLGSNTCVIDICVDSKYNFLNDTKDRMVEIAYEIAKEIDNKNNVGSLGKCKLTGYKEGRISNKPDYITLSLFIEIPTPNI